MKKTKNINLKNNQKFFLNLEFKILNFHRKQLGFTLIFSLIIISIVSSISFFIYEIITKELSFSYLSQESQRAFYAADTGIECALYWDIKQDAFNPVSPSSITCAEQSATVGGVDISSFSLTFDDNSCVDVTVDKSDSDTIITSLGRSRCVSGDPQTVERGLEVRY
jgi:Tfp pilus assembly protein PilX